MYRTSSSMYSLKLYSWRSDVILTNLDDITVTVGIYPDNLVQMNDYKVKVNCLEYRVRK